MVKQAKSGGASKTHGLTITRVFDASPEQVYDAWITPAALATWLLPSGKGRTEAQVDPRVGGRYRILMLQDDGKYDHLGEYLVMERPSKLVFTWIFQGGGHDETLITIDFAPEGEGKCKMTFRHERVLDRAEIDDYEAGWNQTFNWLEKLLAD